MDREREIAMLYNPLHSAKSGQLKHILPKPLYPTTPLVTPLYFMFSTVKTQEDSNTRSFLFRSEIPFIMKYGFHTKINQNCLQR